MSDIACPVRNNVIGGARATTELNAQLTARDVFAENTPVGY
ncbi:hypothetical protein L1277_000567 [Okibacterium sp. HSC-33S16]|nr:hypothetical protein [Okibacterium sp. HSC-33S16]MCP2030503.1 hypothetical protein [Okibacterium sp. HSC-33S16]